MCKWYCGHRVSWIFLLLTNQANFVVFLLGEFGIPWTWANLIISLTIHSVHLHFTVHFFIFWRNHFWKYSLYLYFVHTFYLIIHEISKHISLSLSASLCLPVHLFLFPTGAWLENSERIVLTLVCPCKLSVLTGGFLKYVLNSYTSYLVDVPSQRCIR